MATAVAYRYTYKELVLPKWDFQTWVAREGTNQFFSVRHFCKWLDIASNGQVAVLQNDSRFPQPDILRPDVPFKTGAGLREGWGIHREKLALWMLLIDPKRCNLGSRDRIEEFQEDVLAEAQRLLFGAKPRGKHSELVVEVHVRAEADCPECGTPLIMIYENGKATLVRALDREEE